MALHQSILDTIGKTPLIRLNKLAPADVDVYVKVEAFNPMGSVKDRMALAMIEAAERSGQLQPGQTVIEATSGNTGLGLAMVCAQKGYPLVVVMAENFSIERRKLLRFLGAQVVLTPAAEKGSGMMKKAEELAAKHNFYLCRQFDNQANADIHTLTTAQEIITDLNGRSLDYWVTGFGTGGTLQGVARGLKAYDRSIQIVVAEPDNSQLFGGQAPQPRNASGQVCASHPHFRPHLMQGWVPDFISDLAQSALDDKLIDSTLPVSGQSALAMAKQLAKEEGILAGISSGATLSAALQLASRAKPGSTIVCMLPDTGERYLSTPLFDDISIDMTEQESALSLTTPGYNIARPAPKSPTSAYTLPSQTERALIPSAEQRRDAKAFIEQTVQQYPVVLFALEWCEFCWSLRKLFKALQIHYVSIDIDSLAYQDEEFGRRVRAVLVEQYQLPTIPQVFIGGKCIGGASDVLSQLDNNQLWNTLRENAVAFTPKDNMHSSRFLPNWVHPKKIA